MQQQKKLILTFFPNSKVRKEYEEMFPYKKMKSDFQFVTLTKNLINKSSINELDLNLNSITRGIHALMHKCEMLRKRYATTAYLSRARGYYPSKFDSGHIEFGPYPKAKHLKRLLVMLLSNQIGVLLLRKLIMIFFHFENRRWCNKPKNLHCILLPYTGGISVEWDFLVWFGRKSGTTTIAIQENWDNLSSKQFLFEKPDIFTTWGKQSSSHLRTIQNFRGIVKEVGCIRVQGFYERRGALSTDANVSINQVHFNSKPILVVGVGDDLADLKLLKDLSNHVEESQESRTRSLSFIYRPHPYPHFPLRNQEVLEKISELPHVDIDRPSPTESNSQRIQKIDGFNIVVSHFSTMVLESAILNKTCILPTFVFKIPGYESQNLIDDYYHFSGVSLLSNIKVADTLDSFIDIVLDNNEKVELNRHDDKLLNWFCKRAHTQDELCDVINSI